MDQLPRDHDVSGWPPRTPSPRSCSSTSLPTRWDTLFTPTDGYVSTRSSPHSPHRPSPPKPPFKGKSKAKGKAKFLKRRPSFLGLFLGHFRRRHEKTHDAPDTARAQSPCRRRTVSLAAMLRSGPESPARDEIDSENDTGDCGYGGASAGPSGGGILATTAMGVGLHNDDGDPFKTPPRTPTNPQTNTDASPTKLSLGPPLSPILSNSPGSTRSEGGSRNRRRARLMSRMKLVQILGAEASGAVARTWERDGGHL